MKTVPAEIRTERLYLRPWREEDATRLLPILDANVDHLAGWIPVHVAAPAPLPELEARLAGFAADFVANRSWRYAMFTTDNQMLGEVSLFPRSAIGRVQLGDADRVEIGYWLRKDMNGRGYATEAARALFELSITLPGMKQIEIRCNPLNAPSAAIPRRLGFRLSIPEPDMVWIHEF